MNRDEILRLLNAHDIGFSLTSTHWFCKSCGWIHRRLSHHEHLADVLTESI